MPEMPEMPEMPDELENTTKNTTEGAKAPSPEKLYAGRYITVEALENGYKELQREVGSLHELKQKVTEYEDMKKRYSVPNSYELGEEFTEEVDETALTLAKGEAKTLGLAGFQFEEHYRRVKNRIDKEAQESAEKIKKVKDSIGEQKYQSLSHYIKNTLKVERSLEEMSPSEIETYASVRSRGLDSDVSHNSTHATYQVTREDVSDVFRQHRDDLVCGDYRSRNKALDKMLASCKALSRNKGQGGLND